MPAFRPPSALLYPALLALLVILFFWKLTLSGHQYTWTDSPDIANQVLPWWNFQAREWQAGRFPAWETNHWAGQPLPGQAQPGAVYPLNWLLFLTPLKNGLVLRDSYLNWYFVLLRIIAALNTYLLARYFTRSRGASLFAGLLFSLGGFVGNTDWPQMVNGAIWAPLVFLFQAKALNGERPYPNALLSGFFLGLSWLSGHHQIPTFFTYATAGVWLYACFRAPRANLPLFGVFLATLATTSAAQILPAYEYGKLAHRWVGLDDPVDWQTKVPYFIHREFSAGLLAPFAILLPGFSRAATTGFLGITAITLATLAVLRWFTTDLRIRILVALAAGSLLFAIGGESLVHGLLYALGPLVEKARSPNMAIVVFDLAAALLAAYGFDALLADPRPASDRLAWILASVAAVILVPVWAKMIFTGRDSLGDDRILLSAFLALTTAALLAAYRRLVISVPFLAAALAGITLLELYAENSNHYRNRFQKRADSSIDQTVLHDDIAAFLRAQHAAVGPFRVEVDDQKIPYNFGDWHGVEQINGYLASLTANILRLDIGSDPARRLFGTRYWVGAAPQSAAQTLVFRGRSGKNVYENPGTLPRVWSVHTVLDAANDDELRGLLQNPRVAASLDRVAFLKGGLPQNAIDAPFACAPEPDQIRITNYEPGSRIRIAARMSCRGFVTLSDTWYPGWQATLDGTPVTIHEAYGCLRGVVVGAGEHVLEYRYQPTLLYAGFGLTSISFAAAIFGFVRRR